MPDDPTMRWFILALLLLTRPALAAEPVDLALVLVTDVSRSIDDVEYDLEKRGTAAAITDPGVLKAIRNGALGKIAVAYIEFAGPYEVRTVIPFTVISSAGMASDFATRLLEAPRNFYGRTSISAGIDAAVDLLARADLEPQRRVIDVCGDGTNNAGRDIQQSRDDAVRQNITINGLTIINDHPVSYTFAHVAPPGGLTEWYRNNVTGGPGSFVLEVHDFQTFGDAMTRKMISEIAAIPPAQRFAAALPRPE
jgi:hypothetical protein